METKKWVVEVQQDVDGEYFLEFPEGCLPSDWIEGTVVEWVDQKDGSWLLRKKSDE